ncbi:PaaX family transcriptional regulator C-terminal domain-containing protein [Alloalcanivorax sp. C16-2]|uniref:PaaX family transcriptional regulator C-terminal domain-containing protein n=1 Tax=Alloalcanivorax sp. C16-2 TaxID=3390052 RepID=UPI003970982D
MSRSDSSSYKKIGTKTGQKAGARSRAADPPLAAGDLVLDLLSTHDAHQLTVAALCHAAEICGVRPQNVRVALNRLLAQGKLDSPERGLYRLDTGGSGLFAEVANWLRREQQAVPWRGGWAAVLDSAVPRGEKTAWRRHERALTLRGLRKLGDTGLRLRPDNLTGGIDGLRHDLRRLGLADGARVFRAADFDATDEQAARGLWDTAALGRQYRDMEKRLATSHRKLARQAPEQAARDSLLLGRAAIRCILHDPLLPDELMDQAPRHRLIERMGAYQRDAKAIWMGLLDAV